MSLKESLGRRTGTLVPNQKPPVSAGTPLSDVKKSIAYSIEDQPIGAGVAYVTKTDLRRLGYKQVPETIAVRLEYTLLRKGM